MSLSPAKSDPSPAPPRRRRPQRARLCPPRLLVSPLARPGVPEQSPAQYLASPSGRLTPVCSASPPEPHAEDQVLPLLIPPTILILSYPRSRSCSIGRPAVLCPFSTWHKLSPVHIQALSRETHQSPPLREYSRFVS